MQNSLQLHALHLKQWRKLQGKQSIFALQKERQQFLDRPDIEFAFRQLRRPEGEFCRTRDRSLKSALLHFRAPLEKLDAGRK